MRTNILKYGVITLSASIILSIAILIDIKGFHDYDFGLLIFYLFYSVIGIILLIFGSVLKNKTTKNQTDSFRSTFTSRESKLKIPLILLSIGIVLSVFVFVNFNILYEIITKPRYNPVSSLIIQITFLILLYILTFSLILFLVGIIFLIVRIVDQIKRDNQNYERKKVFTASIITIVIGFVFSLIAQNILLIFYTDFMTSYRYFSRSIIFLTNSTGFYNGYFQGLIFIMISLILSIGGIYLLANGITSQKKIQDITHLEIKKEILKKNTRWEFKYIYASIATVLSIISLIILIIFSGYYIKSPEGSIQVNVFMSISGKFVLLDQYYLFSLGFSFFTVSIILYIIEIIKSINFFKKSENNDRYRNSKIQRPSLILIFIGIISSLVAFSIFILFIIYILTNDPFLYRCLYIYFVPDSIFHSEYIIGFCLFLVSVTISVVGGLQLILRKNFDNQAYK